MGEALREGQIYGIKPVEIYQSTDVGRVNPQTAAYLRDGNTLAGLKTSNKYLAGPEGQHKYSSWPKGPAKELQQPEAVIDLLWPEAKTS